MTEAKAYGMDVPELNRREIESRFSSMNCKESVTVVAARAALRAFPLILTDTAWVFESGGERSIQTIKTVVAALICGLWGKQLPPQYGIAAYIRLAGTKMEGNEVGWLIHSLQAAQDSAEATANSRANRDGIALMGASSAVAVAEVAVRSYAYQNKSSDAYAYVEAGSVALLADFEAGVDAGVLRRSPLWVEKPAYWVAWWSQMIEPLNQIAPYLKGLILDCVNDQATDERVASWVESWYTAGLSAVERQIASDFFGIGQSSSLTSDALLPPFLRG